MVIDTQIDPSAPKYLTLFQRAAVKSESARPASIAALLPYLAHYYHWVEGGRLFIPIPRTYMSGAAQTVVRAVMRDPALKPHIVFQERGENHTYDDIVWDMQDRGLKLAREIYRGHKDGAQKMQRIVITPPIIGREREEKKIYRCKDLITKSSDERTVRIVVRIETDSLREAGLRQIIQTDNIRLESADGGFRHSKILALNMTGSSACVAPWQDPVIKTEGATHELHI